MERIYSDIYKDLSMKSLEGEIWCDIKGYEAMYQVSNLGRVRSFLSNRILNQYFGGNEQLQVVLCGNGEKKKRYVSVIVGTTFIGECDRSKNEVYCHLNMIKTDNRMCNISIESKSNERLLAYRHGRLRTRNIGRAGEEKRFQPKYIYVGTRRDGSEERYTSDELVKKYRSGKRSIIRCIKGTEHFLSAYEMTWRRELIS